jgi:hypothetical protein
VGCGVGCFPVLPPGEVASSSLVVSLSSWGVLCVSHPVSSFWTSSFLRQACVGAAVVGWIWGVKPSGLCVGWVAAYEGVVVQLCLCFYIGCLSMPGLLSTVLVVVGGIG